MVLASRVNETVAADARPLPAVANGVSYLFGPALHLGRNLPFNHDPNDGLGARGAQQYATSAIEIVLGFGEGLLHRAVAREIETLLYRDIDEDLRIQRNG